MLRSERRPTDDAQDEANTQNQHSPSGGGQHDPPGGNTLQQQQQAMRKAIAKLKEKDLYFVSSEQEKDKFVTLLIAIGTKEHCDELAAVLDDVDNDEAKEIKMDTDKWKSIAVPIDTWKKLQQLAKENFRTVGGTITYLTEKEYESNKLVDEKV